MRLLAMAGDAGGARAVAPVIAELAGRGHDVECRAYGPAATIWRAQGLRVEPASTTVGLSRAAVLGTSVNPERHELLFIAAAARAGVRTIGVLDSWVHYRERFLLPDGTLRLPDLVAVMDEAARVEAIAAGLPVERVVVTGQPAFDALESEADVFQTRRASTRKALGIADEIAVLFVSQPLHELYRASDLGFDVPTVLRQVVEALGSVLLAHRSTGRLLVKLHPREMGAPYAVPDSPGGALGIHLLPDDRLSPRSLVAASDLVIGMNSILLLEACLLRVPTVSYQPGIRIPDPLPANRLGWSAAVTDPSALRPTLDAELFQSDARARRRRALASASIPGGAARRVADILLADLPQ